MAENKSKTGLIRSITLVFLNEKMISLFIRTSNDFQSAKPVPINSAIDANGAVTLVDLNLLYERLALSALATCSELKINRTEFKKAWAANLFTPLGCIWCGVWMGRKASTILKMAKMATVMVRIDKNCLIMECLQKS